MGRAQLVSLGCVGAAAVLALAKYLAQRRRGPKVCASLKGKVILLTSRPHQRGRPSAFERSQPRPRCSTRKRRPLPSPAASATRRAASTAPSANRATTAARRASS
ncbi:hypothetical protein M885DRAFT_245958 [Pelagophyceae sp. CCMP2097]|nr:hypothetical protein M885DRAFT_245958 [Pelagophyceae sp. CCMP2097]